MADTGPLDFMERLSDTVYVCHPASGTTATASDSASPRATKPPKLVLVLSWMGARPTHIAKYLAPYRDGLFGPGDAPCIVLVRCNEDTMLATSRATASARLAASAVRSVLGDDAMQNTMPARAAEPTLFVHVFSNGGCSMLSTLYDLIDPTHTACLPPHVTAFDSCPGHFRYRSSVAAFSAQLGSQPWYVRLVALPLIHGLMAFTFVRGVMTVNVGRAMQWLRQWMAQSSSTSTSTLTGRKSARLVGPALWHAHNDRSPTGGNRCELRRSYLYSSGDAMILASDVEEHAEEARVAGFTVAHMESFPESAHVSHARTDGQRYWKAIRDLWAGV